MNTNELDGLSSDQKVQKIESLREMITSAEKTIQSAKAMLLQIEGKKKVGRKRKVDEGEDGHVVQGTFDGQIMIGADGKQYPVPANYASKSKLVEGDLLKLTISNDGMFLYKQIGPVPRQNKIGIVGQDASGNFFVTVEQKVYRVLLASVTYFKAEPGDEVVIVTGHSDDSSWASIESILSHNDGTAPAQDSSFTLPENHAPQPKTATGMLTGQDAPASEEVADMDIEMPKEVSEQEEISFDDDSSDQDASEETPGSTIVEEWVPDIDEIEKEIRAEMGTQEKA